MNVNKTYASSISDFYLDQSINQTKKKYPTFVIGTIDAFLLSSELPTQKEHFQIWHKVFKIMYKRHCKNWWREATVFRIITSKILPSWHSQISSVFCFHEQSELLSDRGDPSAKYISIWVMGEGGKTHQTCNHAAFQSAKNPTPCFTSNPTRSVQLEQN